MITKLFFFLGKDWLNGFLKRNPDVTARRAQHLNEARATKLNRPIVQDYFDKLKAILLEKNIFDKPQHIYNMDEKGIRLCLHKSPVVLAKKGSKRVHYRGKEHGENVTIVGTGSALGSAIPPLILFKGVRKNKEWLPLLPTGSDFEMTPKGSMTIPVFVKFLQHFAKFKTAGMFVKKKSVLK